MKKSGTEITRQACLYETELDYVTDQSLFLNSAIKGVTKLGPHELLSTLKKIEKELGRTKGIRYYSLISWKIIDVCVFGVIFCIPLLSHKTFS
ncbi:putative 7,8-Dihydro-6-hydroxymethylpterin-pyrophosphokinase, HPPK [Helianthus anomalus]